MAYTYTGLSVVFESTGSILKSTGRRPSSRGRELASDVRGYVPPGNVEIAPSETLFSTFLRPEKQFCIPGFILNSGHFLK